MKYFKNIPRSPPHRATGPKCNFFFKFATRSLEKKGHVAPPTGDRGGLSPPPRATGVSPPIKAPTLPFPPHLSPKIPPKIQKKREG